MIGLVIGAAVAAAPVPLVEIDRAIAMQRFDQARMMIAAAVRQGVSGPAIDRPLASLAFAAGRHDEALARLTALLVANPTDAKMLEQATISAIRLGKIEQATALAERATRERAASWRAWNAKAMLADAAQDWAEADRA